MKRKTKPQQIDRYQIRFDEEATMANENRLIDANDVYSLFGKNGTARLHVADIDLIRRVDAVEVVRCKDCKYAYINSFSAASGVAVCKKWSNEAETVIVQYDDFCSYGERRTDNA